MSTREDFKEEFIPNEETLQAMDDVNNGRNLIGPFSSFKEFMDYMENEQDNE